MMEQRETGAGFRGARGSRRARGIGAALHGGALAVGLLACLSPQVARAAPWWVTDAAEVSADCIVVTPEAFSAEARLLAGTLADLRDLRTVCVTLAEIRAAFPGALPDSADSASIREALAFAYQHWRTTPLFALLLGDAAEAPSQTRPDLIPTPHFSQGESGGWCDGTYAMDAWYGDVVADLADAREIVVGRLPIRSAEQADDYRAKLYFYTFLQAPLPRVGMVVGDLSLMQDNANRRPAAQRVLTYIRSVSPLDTTALYSHDFSALIPPAGDYLPEEVGAGRDRIIDLIDGGVGILEFFGNTYPAEVVTHTLWYNQWQAVPQFRAAMLANRFRWPFAIFDHCKVGAFDEYAYLGISPLEDFVLEPAAGAIAAIGKGQMTYFEADEPISRFLYEELLAGGGGSSLGFQVNGALERYLRSPLSSRAEADHTAQMVNFIGDPTLSAKLGLTPGSLRGSFESWGAVPCQDRLAARPDWVSENLDREASVTRVVHAGGGPRGGGDPRSPVAPIDGQRMLSLAGHHAADGGARRCAWTLFRAARATEDVAVRLSAGAGGPVVLSYWVHQQSSPSGRGRVFVDLIAEDGRVLSQSGDSLICDSRGRPFDGEHIDYPLGVWTHCWVRLDEWASRGVGIDSVVVRYKEDGSGSAPIAACVDAIEIGEWPAGEADPGGGPNLLLNGRFTRDRDEDLRPDFWTGAHPDLGAPPGGFLCDQGDTSVVMDRRLADPAAMTQILPAGADPSCWAIALEVRGWPDGEADELAIRLRDLSGGGEAGAERVIRVGPEWERHVVVLRPDAPGHRPLLELEALSGSLRVMNVTAARRAGTDAPPAARLAARPAVRARPTVTRGRLDLSVSPDLAPRWRTGHSWDVALRAPDGRRLGSERLTLTPGSLAAPIDLERMARGRIANGLYVLEVRGEGSSARVRVLLVR